MKESVPLTDILRIAAFSDGVQGGNPAGVWIGEALPPPSEMGALAHAIGPSTLGGSPVTIHLAVPDVDQLFERAVEAGAKARMAPADMFWGDRYGVVEDPFGHRWSMATHIRDVSPEEMARAMQQGFPEGQ